MIGGVKIHLGILIFTLMLFLGIGTFIYHKVENWGLTDSFYFSATTLSTVGYGDLYPTTKFSKIFTSFYMLIGAGIVVSTLTLIGFRYLERKEKEFVRLNEVRMKYQSRYKSKSEQKLDPAQTKLET